MKKIALKTSLVLCAFLMLGGIGVGQISSSVSAEMGENITVLANDDYRLTNEYIDFYSVPSSVLSYTNNGGCVSGCELAKAFDRNFNTAFKSAQDNNVSYVDPESGETKQNFINYIDIDFSKEVKVDRILYGSESAGMARGYPIELNVYIDQGGSLQLVRKFESNFTANMVIFDLGGEVKTTKIRFEYVQVAKKFKYVASAREIIFLQKDSGEFNDYNDLFTNYNQLKLSEKYNTIQKVSEFERILKKNINFDEKISSTIQRAKNVALGRIYYDERKEFTTGDGLNHIAQNGNVVSYCKNTLKFNSFGTNRLVTGIAAKPYQKITVYVEAKDGDPLPRIRFSQNYNFWSSWLGAELNLKRGKNVFTVPYFINSSYTVQTVAGGAIYLVNPYTSEEQSSSVKIYFEGGEFFPVYRKGDDENRYISELKEYTKLIEADPENVIDITEIETDHVMLSAGASGANELYATFSPKKTVENWDTYVQKLLEFGGVEFDKTKPLYNKLNEYANVNFRIVQPWPRAAAYAHAEHIGVYRSVEKTILTGENLGWGVAHEIGHMIDIPGRTIGETTNNMFAKYDETALARLSSRGFFDLTTNSLSSDLVDTSGFFNSQRYNFNIWWNIESVDNGFWGRMENCYRDMNPKLKQLKDSSTDIADKINNLNSTEKNVLFSSLASGYELSYYFQRWGFSLNTSDSKFAYSSASDNFKYCLQKGIDEGIIDNTIQNKYWYLDAKEYNFVADGGQPLYDGSNEVSVSSVIAASDGNGIFFDVVKNEAHLGYEILQGNETDGYKVIGFTYGSSFYDNNTYENGYVPTYKIRAYDRFLNTTKLSAGKSPTANELSVCKIGEVYYNSLSEAVAAVEAGGTIKLLKSSYENKIAISKDINIELDESVTNDITLFRVQSGNMLTVNAGAILTIKGSSAYRIIFSGNNATQSGSLINVTGTLNAEYVTLEDNLSSDYGAIHCDDASGRVNLKACIIKNNRASNGSAVANKGTSTLINCDFFGNLSEKNGALYNYGGGILKIADCNVYNNTAIYGGGLCIDGYTEIKNSQVYGNTAIYGGGIYYSTDITVRRVMATSLIISNNTAISGKDIFMQKGEMNFTSLTLLSSGEMVLKSGKVTVENTCSILGKIVLTSGVNFVVNTAFYPDIASTKFELDSPTDGMIVLTTNGFDLSDEDYQKLSIFSDLAEKTREGNSVVAKLKNITLTIKYNESTKALTKKIGENFALSAEYDKQNYIEKYTDQAGNIYYPNKEFALYEDQTLTATIKAKARVTLKYFDKEIEMFVTPNTFISLPSGSKQEKKISSWKTSFGSFKAGEDIFITCDDTIVAEYEPLMKITYLGRNGVVIQTQYLSYNSKFTLSNLQEDSFAYWTHKGQRITGELTAYDDILLQAVYSSTPTNPDEDDPNGPDTMEVTISSLPLILGTVGGLVLLAVIIIVVIVIKKKKHKAE